MDTPTLCIRKIERRQASGTLEELVFEPGVNLLVGRPNTGKTKWLQTMDFLLGDPGENPFEGADETGLSEKYDAAALEFEVAGERTRIERRWREPGSKTKVLVGDTTMSAREFQHWLMKRLHIPLLSFPKGNPMSGQTWPELSFRMLFRHIYRQQRFWGGIADQQPEGEQHACLLQFLGLAERIYTDDYGKLIGLKTEVEKLKTRRTHYSQTLNEVAGDVIAEADLKLSVTASTIKAAEARLTRDTEALRERRNALVHSGADRAIPAGNRGHISELSEKRAATLIALEERRRTFRATAERLEEIDKYRKNLGDEMDRIARAEDAGAVLADLRITHCPACDQTVEADTSDLSQCFLCHQSLPEEPIIKELGAVRLRYELDRLSGEFKEAEQLREALLQERSKLQHEISNAEEELKRFENELIPARQAVSALIQEEVSALDVALGQLSERQRQLTRITGAFEIGTELSKRIEELEKKIAPLQAGVDEMARATDFEQTAALLEDGMNEYLSAINVLRPDIWRHSAVRLDLSKSGFTIKVGARRWHAALGGTDTLYFLMAYHYGLLTLSARKGCHYPGVAIIDLPGEFSGEAVEDKENFIVQPFIDLLAQNDYSAVQLIMTGAAFSGLKGAGFQYLTEVFAA